MRWEQIILKRSRKHQTPKCVPGEAAHRTLKGRGAACGGHTPRAHPETPRGSPQTLITAGPRQHHPAHRAVSLGTDTDAHGACTGIQPSLWSSVEHKRTTLNIKYVKYVQMHFIKDNVFIFGAALF